MFNAQYTQPGQLIGQVQQGLMAMRAAMAAVSDMYAWSSGVSSAELVACGLPQADADALLSAIADAHGIAMIFNTGSDPRNPPANYVYGASVRRVIGARVQ